MFTNFSLQAYIKRVKDTYGRKKTRSTELITENSINLTTIT